MSASFHSFDRYQVYRKSDSLVCREIAGESILVPVRGQLAQLQKIFVLNDVGAHIWQLFDGQRDLAAIQSSLVQNFDVSPEEAQEDLADYVARLSDAGLVEKLPAPLPESS